MLVDLCHHQRTAHEGRVLGVHQRVHGGVVRRAGGDLRAARRPVPVGLRDPVAHVIDQPGPLLVGRPEGARVVRIDRVIVLSGGGAVRVRDRRGRAEAGGRDRVVPRVGHPVVGQRLGRDRLPHHLVGAIHADEVVVRGQRVGVVGARPRRRHHLVERTHPDRGLAGVGLGGTAAGEERPLRRRRLRRIRVVAEGEAPPPDVRLRGGIDDLADNAQRLRRQLLLPRAHVALLPRLGDDAGVPVLYLVELPLHDRLAVVDLDVFPHAAQRLIPDLVLPVAATASRIVADPDLPARLLVLVVRARVVGEDLDGVAFGVADALRAITIPDDLRAVGQEDRPLYGIARRVDDG